MIQQLLMQFTGTLNRRRAYAATHPMVREAEERLLMIARDVLASGEALSMGVARSELLINGTPYETKGSFARELARHLHRRGVGAVLLEPTVSIEQLRAALSWLASDPESVSETPPADGGVRITTLEYDHLVLDDEARDGAAPAAPLWRTLAELAGLGVEVRDGATPIVSLWRTLAEIAEIGGRTIDDPPHTAGTGADGRSGAGDGIGGSPGVDLTLSAADGERIGALALISFPRASDDVDGIDTAAVIAKLRATVGNPAVAGRAALALMAMASAGTQASPQVRSRIGRELHDTLQRLGGGAYAPIIRSLADRVERRSFVTQVVEVLPVAAIIDWLTAAATANDQQMSHQVLRLMTKMAALTSARGDAVTELNFRDAAQELVAGWDLENPNPAEHVELLDRIASFERMRPSRRTEQAGAAEDAGHMLVESMRLVQMALEIDYCGEDTAAAAEAMIAAGAGQQLMEYIASAPSSASAAWLQNIATSDRAVRLTLLSEPVDRLQARALLDLLDPSSAAALIDVLEAASTRGTRMIVRQRLADFGEAIEPLLVARLEDAPWFLIRNILTLLQEMSANRGGSASASEFMLKLLQHDQAQVRVEALRVLLHDAGARDAALRCALRDDAERVVQLAVQNISETADAGVHIPASVVTQLMAIVDAGVLGDSVRARAVRALATVVRDDIRDWLLSLVAQRSRFLRRVTLAEPTQTAISALQVLRRVYPSDAAVTQLVALVTRNASHARWLQKDITGVTERSA